MPVDDNPLNALQKQLDMETLSSDPIIEKVLKAASRLKFGPPFDQILGKIRDSLGAESLDRIKIMLETCITEVKRLDREFTDFRDCASPPRQIPNHPDSAEALKDAVLDAARKAENTRSKERIKRIGLILAHAIVQPNSLGADEVEEMMRVAMELGDRDVELLRELIKIEGHLLQSQNYIPRYTAHTQWESGPWGTRVDPELDSVFSKLESYGLVSRIAPPNNQNISADIQNRYVLLKKGLRFTDLVRQTAFGH